VTNEVEICYISPAGIFLVSARKIRKNRLRGSDTTAASGGRREGSEWQRSKFRERIANKKFWVPQQDGTDREAYRRILLFVLYSARLQAVLPKNPPGPRRYLTARRFLGAAICRPENACHPERNEVESKDPYLAMQSIALPLAAGKADSLTRSARSE